MPRWSTCGQVFILVWRRVSIAVEGRESACEVIFIIVYDLNDNERPAVCVR